MAVAFASFVVAVIMAAVAFVFEPCYTDACHCVSTDAAATVVVGFDRSYWVACLDFDSAL